MKKKMRMNFISVQIWGEGYGASKFPNRYFFLNKSIEYGNYNVDNWLANKPIIIVCTQVERLK